MFSFRLIICFLLLLAGGLCIPGKALAQSETWRGYVTSDGSRIPYLVTFARKGSAISGSSITDWQKSGALKASVRGSLSESGVLTIQEYPTPGENDYFGSTYCYFLGKLRMKTINGKKYWTGIYTSTRKDGSSCGYGEMVLNDPDPPPPIRPVVKPSPKPTPRPVLGSTPRVVPTPPRPKPKPTPPRDTVKPPPPRDTIKPPPPIPLPAPKPDTVMYPNLYEWAGDTLSLQLWDGFEEDGDVVSLLWDGKMMLDHQRLNNKVKIPLNLLLADRQTHTLTIRLHGQGSMPPNTPNLILTDGKDQKSLEISGADGEEAVMRFRKKR